MKKTNFLIFLLLIGLFIIFAGSCKKDDIPVLTTVEVTDITLSTAKSGGNITSEGGLKVVGRGVCWSTSANPSIADSHTTDGFGAGSFTSILTGLYGGTTYYVRAYATNINETYYGEQRSFQTQNGMASVTTNDISNITTTSATCGGNVTFDGGFPVTARGVCWSTSANPTIADSHTTDGSGVGSFTSVLTGLHLETTYYVRAYATNSNGTGYGATMTFKTETGGVSFTDPRDGTVYQTITIGNQVWMAENLKYLPSVVGPYTSSATTPYYYVYNYDGTDVNVAKATESYQTYGVLYNWEAARRACPAGWHLPSDAEWEELENFLADNGYNYDGSTGGGRDKIAKAMASTTGWNSSSNTGAVGNTDYSQYQNKSGFTALPGGLCDFEFYYVGSRGFWWSATDYDPYSAWYRDLGSDYSNVDRYGSSKELGFSVRCVKD